MKRSLKKLCAECGSDNVIYDREKDQSICQDCGAIFEELAPEEEDEFEEVFEEDVPKHAKVKAKKKKK
jgi:transcription initiation factor TFIIIB Brf1 subunit/transcription initiation factor TFIIB